MNFLFQPPFGRDIIEQIIPHRDPFLLVDQITRFDDKGVRALLRLDPAMDVFRGHFPGHPVFPGVLQVEAMAQAGAVWILAQPENAGKIAYLMTVSESKFRRPAVPGDLLEIEGEVKNLKSRTGQLDARILVAGREISSTSLMFAFAKETAPASAG